jgi:hypothetical protein
MSTLLQKIKKQQKEMKFVISQTTTRKNKDKFYINKNIMTRKTHGNWLNITKKAFKQGNKWRHGNKRCEPYLVVYYYTSNYEQNV